jgi:type II secretory ATPase GspE/PulE/Tfp pilus assembly ATPase PilB-like protein
MSRRLGKELVKKGLLSKKQLDEATEISTKSHEPLSAVLIDQGLIKETDLLKIQAHQHGMDFVDLKETAVDEAAIKSVSAKLVSHYRIVPVKLESGVLTIAVSNPLDMSAAEDIETNLGYSVERVLACRGDILEALREYYGVGADTVEKILAESPEREAAESTSESHDLEKMAEDASVVKLVNQLFHEAIDDRATDIHFEVGRDNVVVRRRIDGVLYDTSVPKNIRLLYPAIVSRIKLMSGLNIVERRLPQDGRSRVKIGRKEYDLRISIMPAIHGEDIVIRILPATMLFDLGELGLSESHLAVLQDCIEAPHGIVFVTGPTGSGKSTTLYACLSKLNRRSHKIVTIEDPVEYELKGITQTQVNPKIGLTFARALRSMLRHDPDVMMVGEVRDKETAEIAIQTAMTGHLVLSTLHTNDAAGGSVRLIDMGIDPYLITSTVEIFMAQRLVRVICKDCKEEYESDGKTLYRGAGCRKCNDSGYYGRLAICELLPLNAEIQALILQKASAKAVREKADSLGMSTLAQDGWDKVARGVTTAEEVARVTSM